VCCAQRAQSKRGGGSSYSAPFFGCFACQSTELISNKFDFGVYTKRYRGILILVSIGPIWSLLVNLISRFIDFCGFFWEVVQDFTVQRYFGDKVINILYRLKQSCPTWRTE
jgi:hypothetical protein